MTRKLLTFLIVVLALGCRDEKDADPANSKTFMRYFGSHLNHTAILAEEADNGISMLSNVDIPVGNLGDRQYRIRFIHTDDSGNTIWENVYPGWDFQFPTDFDGFKGSSFLTLPDGYLIIGDRINATNGKAQLE
ncbi:MAG TPA: hypothetical protein VEB86_12315, partial [Chryseosolibacter sp.]|nr:hypothetical protein [Chryseosolibacter sp.]